MICDLHLEHFLFIDHAHLEFSKGLNVITGETGAGKSVLLEALKLLLGKKGKGCLVLGGFEHAKVQASINIAFAPRAREFLCDKSLLNDEDPNSLTLSRTFRHEGNGKIFVNGILATLSDLRELGIHLMEIHGQNEHQTLLEPRIQRYLLDRFGSSPHLNNLSDLRRVHGQCLKLSQKLATLEETVRSTELRMGELKNTLAELENLGISSPNEVESLHEEERRFLMSEKISSSLKLARDTIEGDRETDGVVSLFFKAREALRKASQVEKSLLPLFERCDSMYFESRDIASELERSFGNILFDPVRMDFIQKRLADISKVSRRYQVDCSGLIHLLKQVKEEISEITQPDFARERLDEDLKKLLSQRASLIDRITNEREKLASFLENRVSEELKHLGFSLAKFRVFSSPCEIGPDGAETVEFLVTLNPGSPEGPLRKIASGGELSRVALAIKKVLAKEDDLSTLIFDEIDSGIGGTTAESVADCLQNLSQSKQVLLVTHLHQIAKVGDRHFVVTKSTGKSETKIRIEALREPQREIEIARMLGTTGSDGIAFARSLLKKGALPSKKKPK